MGKESVAKDYSVPHACCDYSCGGLYVRPWYWAMQTFAMLVAVQVPSAET